MRRGAILSCLLVLLALSPSAAFAWGLVAHRIVTEAAAGRMPPDVGPFFRRTSARLQELSVEPDTVLRSRDATGEEARRHFINLDALEPWPFQSVPREYDEARARFGEDRLKRNGTLPWRIAGVLKDLVEAMRRRDPQGIATGAGWLSHYLADAFQPLHLTKNHDGQETCNLGIHHAFEGEMIERYAARYRDDVVRSRAGAAAVAHPVLFVFDRMRESYPAVERILEADAGATRALKSEGKDYWEELDRRAGPIAERQMSEAATAVASFWYTAWLQAGRPPLPSP